MAEYLGAARLLKIKCNTTSAIIIATAKAVIKIKIPSMDIIISKIVSRFKLFGKKIVFLFTARSGGFFETRGSKRQKCAIIDL